MIIQPSTAILQGHSVRSVLEWVVGNKFYLFLRDPIEALNWGRVKNNGEIPGTVPVSPQDRYHYYLRGIGRSSESGPNQNYIYQIKKVLNLFVFDEYNILRGFSKGIWHPKVKDYFGQEAMSDEEFARRLVADKREDVSYKIRCLLFGGSLDRGSDVPAAFAREWDGVVTRRVSTEYFVNAEVVQQHAVLVDGTKTRYAVKDRPAPGLVIPDWVKQHLSSYTDSAATKLKREVIDWCVANLPHRDRAIYRGCSGFNIPSWDFEDVTLEMIEKTLRRRYGITLDQCVRGQPVRVVRGKESSWSTDPQIARNFSSGQAERCISLLVKANVAASQVVVDFTLLPDDQLKGLDYSAQNEVIVSGPIRGEINGIWCDDKFVREVLNKFGYEYVQQQGIFKRS